MTDLTTIKVPRQTRDRLSTIAAARHTTMRAVLDQLARDAENEVLMDQADQGMRRFRQNDPDGWADYLTEGLAWEEGTVDPVAD